MSVIYSLTFTIAKRVVQTKQYFSGINLMAVMNLFSNDMMKANKSHFSSGTSSLKKNASIFGTATINVNYFISRTLHDKKKRKLLQSG